MQPIGPFEKDLVLIGGGHSHVVFLRMYAMNPIPGVAVTLISDVTHTPYSGMLPGYIAGFYSYDETHIDLRQLCEFANVRFIRANVSYLDLSLREIHLNQPLEPGVSEVSSKCDSDHWVFAQRPHIRFDILSINTGSRPKPTESHRGGGYLIPAKPIPEFLDGWGRLLDVVDQSASSHPVGVSSRVVIVGAGAGGVEVALNMKSRLGDRISITVVDQREDILTGHNSGVQDRLRREMKDHDIGVELNFAVKSVEKRCLQAEDGRVFEFDFGFLMTHASPAMWLKESGLATDGAGFALVSKTLQSISHQDVFVTGDTATMVDYIRPKSGVFAVRQGAPLFANIKAYASGRRMIAYRPQVRFLGLIGTGRKVAVASYGQSIAVSSRFIWLLKDRIDRAFMAKFDSLEVKDVGSNSGFFGWFSRSISVPSFLSSVFGAKGWQLVKSAKSVLKSGSGKSSFVSRSSEDGLKALSALVEQSKFRCFGCAGKVGGATLRGALSRVKFESHHHRSARAVLEDFDDADDAAIVEVTPGKSLVQSIDYFSALVSDPFLLGRIAINHGFSDICAMGATPRTAQILVLIPFASPKIMEEQIFQILSGVVHQLAAFVDNHDLIQSQSSDLIDQRPDLIDQSQEMRTKLKLDGSSGFSENISLETIPSIKLTGGHTAESSGVAIGVVSNGEIDRGCVLKKSGLLAGDQLIVTKALGVGTLFAAAMRYRSRGRWVDQAIGSMLQSNLVASQILLKYGASACTDITGFGLAGHLLEMLRASRRCAKLKIESIPVFEGALITLEQGYFSSLHSSNLKAMADIDLAGNVVVDSPEVNVLFDPQTSGGLIAGIRPEQSEACLRELRAAGYVASCVGDVKNAEVAEITDKIHQQNFLVLE